MPLNPLEWNDLLKGSRNYLDASYARSESARPTRGFISFSWPQEELARKELQGWLSSLRHDLMDCALDDIFLDIVHMDGDLKVAMQANLNKSDVVFFILTARFFERFKDRNSDNGLGYEVVEVFAKANIDIIFLLKEGNLEELL